MRRDEVLAYLADGGELEAICRPQEASEVFPLPPQVPAETVYAVVEMRDRHRVLELHSEQTQRAATALCVPAVALACLLAMRQ